MAHELVLNTDPRKGNGVVYNAKGLVGQIYFPASLFDGKPPATIKLEGVKFVAPGNQRPAVGKMTPEERAKAVAAAKEARKNETPVQKAERLKVQAQKAAERAAKAAAAAAAAAAA